MRRWTKTLAVCALLLAGCEADAEPVGGVPPRVARIDSTPAVLDFQSNCALVALRPELRLDGDPLEFEAEGRIETVELPADVMNRLFYNCENPLLAEVRINDRVLYRLQVRAKED